MLQYYYFVMFTILTLTTRLLLRCGPGHMGEPPKSILFSSDPPSVVQEYHLTTGRICIQLLIMITF